MKKPTHNAAQIVRLPSKKIPTRRNQTRASSRTKELPGENGPTVKRASHWFFTVVCALYVLAIIWTSLAYAAESRTTGNSIAGSRALLRTSSTSGGRLHVRAYVQRSAKAVGVNPYVAEWIVSHESQHRPQATGDGGESRGLWQINRIYHPEVSDRCAYDMECSTDWALQRILDGNANEWSTWKYRKLWFPDSKL
jgi:hypothetical protein